MLRFYPAQIALLLGLLLALNAGCGQAAGEAAAQAAEPAPVVPAAPAQVAAQPAFEPAPAQAAPEQAAESPQAAESASEAPPAIAGDPVLPAPTEAPAPAGDILHVAMSNRTVVDQECPKDLLERWREKINPLMTSDSPIQWIDDPAAADWIIQVAAIERPDVIYLNPGKKLVEKPDDDLFRMSAPGDAAIEWLKIEFENLPDTTGLVKLLVLDIAAATEADAQQAQQAPAHGAAETAFSRPAQPSSSAPTEPSGGSSPFPSFDGSVMRSIFSHEGPAEDLKALIVQEQSGIYHTANRTQALLGTYGKMVPGNKFLGRPAKYEQRTVMQEIDSVRRFTTLDRQGHGNGLDFVSFVGSTRQAWQLVDLAGQVGGGRTNEISFEIVGVRLDQSDAIKALNQDAEALNYFDYVQSNREVPCLILENLVFTSYAAAQGTTFNLGGNAKSVLTGDGGGAEYDRERSTSNQFASPIVRGYQMYQIKLNRGQVVDLVFVDP